MDQNEYKKTKDFIEAKNIIKDFINDALDGDINNLKNNDITLLIRKISDGNKRKKYYGDINDPDMYYITQAIYIVVWGHIYNLTFDNMGSWGELQHPFRGDTMNSFNSIFGKDMLIAKRYNLDEMLMKKVKEYKKLYHSIGNFIVIPNRLNVNSTRANYYTIQDYFDSFIGALYQFKNPSENTEYSNFLKELNNAFLENEEFSNISFEKYTSNFFLEDYLKNGIPYNVFNIPYELREKEYIGRNKRSKTMFISKNEYISMVNNYYEVAKIIIENRANNIINILKNEDFY